MVKIRYDFIVKDVQKTSFCPCCKKDKFTILSDVSSFTEENSKEIYLETSLCMNCGHIFRSKILSEQWMLKMFDKREKIQAKSKFNPINKQVELLRYERYFELGKFVAKFLEDQNKKSLKILDFGCGTGTGLKAFIDLGFAAKGIEPDFSRAKYGIKKRIPIDVSTWQNYLLEGSSDYLFTSIQSLEHFYNAESFIEKVSSSMSLNSLLYIEVPDANNHIKDWNDSLYLGHMHNFCENSLFHLLKRLGFKSIIRCKPYSNQLMNSENLCVFASKLKVLKGSTFGALSLNYIKEYSKKKRLDSVKKLQNYPNPEEKVSFFIEEINDLMFSFKNSSTIDDKVKDNQNQRTIEAIGKNSYHVGY